MNYSTLRLVGTFTACLSLAFLSHAKADESWVGPSGNGGSGTWDFNITPNWDGGDWTNNDQQANFNSNPGLITVDQTNFPVGDESLEFGSNSTAAWDLEPLNTGDSLPVDGNTNALVQNNGNGNVTIGIGMDVDTTRATDRYNITNDGTILNLNGDITFDDTSFTQNAVRSLIVTSGSDSSVININGTLSDSSASGGVQVNLRLAEGGATQDTYHINGNISGLTAGMQIGSGNVIVSPTANLGTQSIFMYNDQGVSGENSALLTADGATISNNLYVSTKYDSGGYGNAVFGGSDATASVFSGNLGLDSSDAHFTAVSGGRVTFTGANGNFFGSAPDGLTKLGAGTVVFAQAAGNSYGTQGQFTTTGPGAVAMDIQQGTLLITNTSGSAFGGGSGIVKVEAGATLGGSGISSQAVVAEAATSIIAAGDAGQSNLNINPSIGTLQLAGGLTATSGLTMNFKFSGMTNDQLMVGTNFTLAGAVAVNLINLNNSTLSLLTPYVLATGSGTWSDLGAVFTTNTEPAGYIVNVAYGVDGYLFNSANDTLTTEFVAVPEPSTYAMMLGGVALLGFYLRRKSVRIQV